MCEFSGKLVALLDGELAAGEAIDVERHLDECAECRNQMRAYERLSHCVDVYCDAKLEAGAPRMAAPGERVLLGAGAAAVVAITAVLLMIPRVTPPLHDEPPTADVSRPASLRTGIAEIARTESVPIRKIRQHPAAAPAQVREASWQPQEPAIEIAIPADAVFPPGAVPEGVSFVANVRIAADGSARQTFVWP
ncbi:MAG: zf-HC2 domain-containing protein [Acidobacteriia bacterium]|nr:zf-HC2 domain-containing protein [Terriglobia bacterium]